MPEHDQGRVLALVLTHNAPQSLARCLLAIAAQVDRPDEVLIVDNASEPRVDESVLPKIGLPLRVVRSEVNGGPAGGWAIAFREFLASDFTHAWVMDDDIIPDHDCLAYLRDATKDAPALAFAFPIAIQPDGSIGRWGSWCGFLVSRDIVDTVGLPLEGLFWWAEDAEYCEWRIPQAGFPRRIIDEAVVQHDAIRQEGVIPRWKYYYESRNSLYYHLYVMHRIGRYPKKITGLVMRALLRQKGDRIGCLRAIYRGLYDGAFGRLGTTYPVSSLHERDLASTVTREAPH